MSNNSTSRLTPGTMIVGVIACVLLAVLTVATLYEAVQHHNKLADATTHTNAATLFQNAENEGKTSASLLQGYVASGDDTVIPQIETHTQTGVQQLTAAVQTVGSDPNHFVDSGSQLVTVSSQVIALRQSGDAAGAASLLTDLSGQFNQFVSAQDQAIASQQAAAAAATSSASNAKTATLWLAIASFVLGAFIVAGGLFVVTRSGRRAVETAPTA